MSESFGVILEKEKMPNYADIQSWFEANGLPCTLDEVQLDAEEFSLSGSILGQRCLCNASTSGIDVAKRSFDMLYVEYFDGFDFTFMAFGKDTMLDGALVSLVYSAVAQLSCGLIVVEYDPNPEDVSKAVSYGWDTIFLSRILLSLLWQEIAEEYNFVDSEALPLMSYESDSDRFQTIDSLLWGKHIEAENCDPWMTNRIGHRLTASGRKIAESLMKKSGDVRSASHFELIVPKESG